MAVLRVNDLITRSADVLALTIERLSMQFNRKYDYAFDYYSASKTTCTEIMSLSFGPIKWKTQKIAGRYTLSPDNMMSMAFDQNPALSFIGFFQGSKKKNLLIKSAKELKSTLKLK